MSDATMEPDKHTVQVYIDGNTDPDKTPKDREFAAPLRVWASRDTAKSLVTKTEGERTARTLVQMQNAVREEVPRSHQGVSERNDSAQGSQVCWADEKYNPWRLDMYKKLQEMATELNDGEGSQVRIRIVEDDEIPKRLVEDEQSEVVPFSQITAHSRKLNSHAITND
jgi:hypothetical protein